MANAYVVYNTTGGLVDGIYMTQALADARAATSTDLSAHTGAVTIPRNVEPLNSYFTAASAEFVIDRLPSELKQKAWQAHYDRREVKRIGEILSIGYPSSAKMKFDDFMYWAAVFGYLVAHDDTLTTAKQIKWFEEMPKGPSNARVVDGDFATAIATFFGIAHTLTAPTGPAAWVDPEDGSARALNNLITRVNTVPATVNFVTGSWIDALPD